MTNIHFSGGLVVPCLLGNEQEVHRYLGIKKKSCLAGAIRKNTSW